MTWILWFALAVSPLMPVSSAADSYAIPDKDLYVPLFDGRPKDLGIARGLESYDLVNTAQNGWIVYLDSQRKGTATLGYISFKDRYGYPSASERSNSIRIRNQVSVPIREGWVPLGTDHGYPVVGMSPSELRLRFTFKEFCRTVSVDRASCRTLSGEEYAEWDDRLTSARREQARQDAMQRQRVAETRFDTRQRSGATQGGLGAITHDSTDTDPRGTERPTESASGSGQWEAVATLPSPRGARIQTVVGTASSSEGAKRILQEKGYANIGFVRRKQ